MKDSKYLIASLVLHGLLFSSVLIKWNWGGEKQTYMDSDVLLMGPKTGDKINPQKKSEVKSDVKPVENDPNAVKTYDKNAADPDAGEGTFGQGGTKPLEYDVELAAWIQANKKYPKMAKRLGQECESIVVTFDIHPDGRLDNILLKEKCQFDMLNDAAIETVKLSSPFKPFPDHFPRNGPLKRIQPFSYKLTE